MIVGKSLRRKRPYADVECVCFDAKRANGMVKAESRKYSRRSRGTDVDPVRLHADLVVAFSGTTPLRVAAEIEDGLSGSALIENRLAVEPHARSSTRRATT
jgi:hypothetical protein